MECSESAVLAFEWITGKRKELPAELGPELPAFANRHRIVGLALRRAKQTPGFPAAALAELSDWHEQIVTKAVRLIRLANDIFRIAETTGTGMVVVKGASAAAVANDPYLYRASGDVDILCEDAELVAARMVEKGFRRASAEYGELEDDHELLMVGDKLYREMSWADLHRYWPVRRSPLGLQAMTELHLPATDKVAYSELASGAGPGRLDETRGSVYPSVEAAVIVALTASARDLIWEPFSNPSVRLCHFTDAYALLTLPTLDFAKLERLVSKHRLESVLSTASEMFEKFFGTNPLARFRMRDQDGNGMLIQFVNGCSGLWHREDLVSVFLSPFDARLRTLGATQLRDGETKRHRSLRDTDFAAAYEASSVSDPPERRLRAVHGSESIVLSIHVEKPPERGDSVIVEAGHEYCHWYHGGKIWGGFPVQVAYSEESFTLDVTLPKGLAGHALMVGVECMKSPGKVVTALPVVV